MSVRETKPITIKLPESLSTDHASNLRAYLVDGAGALVETAGFHGHAARINASGAAVKSSRLFVGPGFPEGYPEAKIDAYALAQIGAYQISPGAGNEIAVQNLPGNIVERPILHFCNIQGNVTNTLTVNGVSQTGPVCKAKVHICSVDWYWRWPIWLRPVVPLAVVKQLQEFIAVRRIQPKHVSATAPKRLPVAIEDQILVATPDTIHEIIGNNAELIHPFICYYPFFWPWFYRVVEQEIVYTDCNGYFDGWLAELGTSAENIYVWVEASINGNWVTVYNPPFPCHTEWDYVCGTEINISLANAAIPPCNCDATVVDGTVWFTAIGGSAIATSIQQNISSTALGIANGGCTNIFDANQLSPFGSSLDLNLATGPTLPASHYRWSWTLLNTAGNPVGPVNQITGAVSRYYLWPLPNNSWETGSISLQDTDTGGNIAYSLPNYDVTSYPGVSPQAEWVSFNFVSAALDSTKIPSGSIIQLNLELLNLEGGLFTPVAVPQDTFQVSNSTNGATAYDGSSAAPSNYLTLNAAADATAFTMIVRVDNSPVTAVINQAWLLDAFGNPVPGGNSGPCGFIQFTSLAQDVSLSFVASEPFNYATFSYGLYKGSSGGIGASSGYVFTASPAFSLSAGAAFTLSGGSFTDNESSVATLLGNCAQAAFAETLGVTSLATDGSSLLANSIGTPYAASTAAAFALTPAPVASP